MGSPDRDLADIIGEPLATAVARADPRRIGASGTVVIGGGHSTSHRRGVEEFLR
jgi:hypothetical protein